jgi:hypothetical protein
VILVHLLLVFLETVHESRQMADGPLMGGAFLLQALRVLELKCSLVIPREVILKHGIDTTLLNIGSGKGWTMS